MGRLQSAAPEVIRRADEGRAEGPLPKPVRDGAPRERIVIADEVGGEGGAGFSFVPGLAGEFGELFRYARPERRGPRRNGCLLYTSR
ncbi:MAG: hypothetical protein NWR99_11990, partial [Verrucomicrobiales bacterium]|nr:hypothetical protein [Verrucomicrobiales bacterium]